MSDSKQLALSSQPPETAPPRGALADLRQYAMSLPVEVLQAGLAEYAERRHALRDWIKSQMVEGVHFGVPPGCEPRQRDSAQWINKPSLYAAGADFICDLMGLLDVYEADMASWEQLGKPAETFVRKCTLTLRANGAKVSEGTGARKVGTKKGDVNNTIKMADKCAKVAAVLNAYGLRDLFTQDLENNQSAHENPAASCNAPKASPRSHRQQNGGSDAVTRDECEAAYREFQTFTNAPDIKAAYVEFVSKATGVNFEVFRVGAWNRQLMAMVQEEIRKQTGAPPDA